MCGLAGYIDLRGAPVEPDVLRLMASALAHRGPDGEGIWHEGNVGLTHRRLAIIDLSEAAHQPMVSADGRYILSFNGMIYNFMGLRSELEVLGYKFVSSSDSEVLLYAMIHWGPQGLTRLNGMFAFALWDCKERTMLLARDRYGIKPLYYRRLGNTFAFGSEVKAILAQPGLSGAVDKEALLEYFTFQNFFTSRTLFKDIQILPAGHYSTFKLGSAEPALELTRYWDFHFREPERQKKPEEYREELDRLFQQAVNRQLVSDVEIGSYLSGGIDSGSITAIASQHHSNLATFTCGFDMSSASGLELSFDERAPARLMSEHFGTNYHEVELKSGDMERALPNLARHLEEPRVGQSYPNYYAAKLASEKVKVVLSGSGGDEMFGGYPWRYYRAASSNNFEHYVDEYYKVWHRLVPNTDIAKLFSPIWGDVKHVWTRDIFSDVFAFHENTLERPEDYINHSLYFEAKTFLHGLLVVEDKLSMAHGLESRVPFLDNDLVDFSMQCPVGLKLNNLHETLRINENDVVSETGKFAQKTASGKQILRDVVGKYLPDEIKNASKQGFSAPDASWFKGESIDFVEDTLLKHDARINEFIDRKTMSEMVDEHMSGKSNRRLFIWALLSFEAFLNEFVN
jgi:asparagine synthase (glutamine-hydrolysing)